jgi:hypothetical protein
MPVVRSTIATPGYAHRAAIVHPHAYVADQDGLLVIDVSNPDAPVLLGHVKGFFATDVAVAGSMAYVSGIGFRIVDVSEPETPQIVGGLELRGGVAVTEDGEVAVVVGEDSLFTIDVRNPSLPVVVGGLRLPPSFGDRITVHEQVAYVAREDHGVCIIDVSRPASPRFVGTVGTEGAVFAVTATEELLYTSGYFDLEIFAAQCGYPTPVSLSGLAAMPIREGIRIGWQVHEGAFTEFEIWRAPGSNPSTASYAAIAVEPEIPADGPWECVDRDVIPGHVYAYKVRALSRHGGVEVLGPVFATALASPALTLRAVPNPAPGETVLHVELLRPGSPHVRIYDAAGRCVRTLLGEPLISGSHSVLWDGRDSRQRRVASGIYIARLTGGSEEALARITLLR